MKEGFILPAKPGLFNQPNHTFNFGYAQLQHGSVFMLCRVLAAHTKEDCSAIQNPRPDAANFQQGDRPEAGFVLQMC